MYLGGSDNKLVVSLNLQGKMNKQLSKNEVLHLIEIWYNWMSVPDPKNNKPQEYKTIYQDQPIYKKLFFGMVLHLFLWLLTRLGQIFKINSLSIWASKKRIKYDSFWPEPLSCGLTNSYTDLGLGYLREGEIRKAIECLDKAWRVYPCPHNSSYGLKLKLYNRLKNYPEAKDVTTEYREMWHNFKRA